MPNLISETIGTGDQSWLGSTHAMYNTQSVALLKSAFTANTHYPNGYIQSGQPISINADGYGVPYAVGAGELMFVLANSKVSTDAYINAAALDHGRVKTANLPVSFTAPAGNGHFVFVPAVADEESSSSSS